jgi:hypothetical protein
MATRNELAASRPTTTTTARKSSLTVKIDSKVFRDLRRHCAKTGLKKYVVVEWAIRAALKGSVAAQLDKNP